jgi:hypothetical protein
MRGSFHAASKRIHRFCAARIHVRRGNDSFRRRHLLSWRMGPKSSVLRPTGPPMWRCCRMAGPGASGCCFWPSPYRERAIPCGSVYYSFRTIAATEDSCHPHHWRAFEEGVGFKARVAGPRGRGAGCLPRPPLPTCPNSGLNRYRSLELRQLIRGGPEQTACVWIMHVIP